MALIKTTLEQSLKSRIKSLEPKLYDALKKQSTGLYNAQSEVNKRIEESKLSPGFNINSYKNKLWKINSEEWGKVISKEIISVLADDLSNIIADEVDKYIKTITVVTPPTGGTGVIT